MSKQYQVTGIGNPNTITGEVKLFTTAKQPFTVTPAWLAEQSKQPAIGDVIEVTDGGAVTLVTEAQALSDAAADEPDAAGSEKKNLTSAGSGSGSELSPFREFAGKPLTVHAAEITEVDKATVKFSDGSFKTTPPDTNPVLGDYWVIECIHNIFYEYPVPKAIFESRYELVEGQ